MDKRPSVIVLLVHLAVTLFMPGLIWFVQIVHYPLFARVDSQVFALYHDAHTRLTTWVVGPAMLVEAAIAVLLLAWRPAGMSFRMSLLGVLALAAIWASTWLLQVPQHYILASGFDDAAHSLLVDSNWIRTCGWTLRSLLALALIAIVVHRSDRAGDTVIPDVVIKDK